MKKKNQKVIWAVLLIGIVAFTCFYFNSISKQGVSNGYWNNDTRECWATPNSLVGEETVDAVSCCFNIGGRQVDCNNPNKFIGSNFLAVYGVQGNVGTPGIFSISHTFLITNTGGVSIEKAWIESADWTPSHSVLSSAYNRIIGSSSSYAKNIPVGSQIAFPTDVFNLRDIGGEAGNPITYNLDMNIQTSAYSGQLTGEKDIVGSITVEKEEIGMNIVVNLGGGYSSDAWIPPAGLIGWWKLDGNTIDSSGNENDGVTHGLLSFVSAGNDDNLGLTAVMVDSVNKYNCGRGIGTVRLDSSENYIESKCFDTYVSYDNSNNLVTYLDSLSSGDIIVFAVIDEASNHLNENLISKLESLGSTEINKLEHRDSWGMISVVGDGKKSESHVPRYSGQARGSLGWVSGKLGKSFELDGDEDYISIPSKPALTSLTQSAWFKYDEVNTGARQLIMREGTGDQCMVYESGGNLRGTAYNGASWSDISFGAISSGVWYHMANTVESDGTNVIHKVYLNGNLKNSHTTSGTMRSQVSATIGGLKYLTNGLVDEVMIYDRSLTADEVMSLYNL